MRTDKKKVAGFLRIWTICTLNAGEKFEPFNFFNTNLETLFECQRPIILEGRLEFDKGSCIVDLSQS